AAFAIACASGENMQTPGSQAGDRLVPLQRLVHDLDDIIGRADVGPDRVLAVKDRLGAFLKDSPALPEPVRRATGDGYARHLLYADPEGRFEMVVMAWSPGQATPVHDHAGIWCVEGVVEGVVEVTRYDLTEMLKGGRARMRRTETIRAGLGQCGALIPPVEYHTIANPEERMALTLHVYGGRMRRCRIFEDRGEGVYEVDYRDLHFASTDGALVKA
ncbi:MAG TPA: cysteine dioxygenase family protein, partial [Candidatus Polarisedimenticolia bacterium]|nr:cysteine dioxygenase family protein [Candidatus Polarisedimenticolia bacterium]